MCQRIFAVNDLNQENYTFIVSNVILSQTNDFTYTDILTKLERMFSEITDNIKNIVNSCLIRLRDDGFLRVLGYKYTVIEPTFA